MNLIQKFMYPPTGSDIDQQIVFYKNNRKILILVSTALFFPLGVVCYLLHMHPADNTLLVSLIVIVFFGLATAVGSLKCNNYCGYLREKKKQNKKEERIQWLKLSN